jgi:alginate O-acetyltransferase complex protein AlgI
LPTLREVISMVTTFCLTAFAWIFFRAENLDHAFDYIARIFTPQLFALPIIRPTPVLVLVVLFIAIEWNGRAGNYAIANLYTKSKPIRWSVYLVLFLVIFLFQGKQQQFIYFQF